MGSLSNSPKPLNRKVRASRRHLLAEKELSITKVIFFLNLRIIFWGLKIFFNVGYYSKGCLSATPSFSLLAVVHLANMIREEP